MADFNGGNEPQLATPPGGWSIPSSAYIHVPFCRHRCGYCNFSVVADRDQWIDRYLEAIDCELELLEHPEVATVFLGGGTPTHLPLRSLERLLHIVASRFHLSTDFEYTIEANPEDITDEKLSLLRDSGVNRISLGVQSFDDQKLGVLERGHCGENAKKVIEQTADVIPNVSIDLIFSAPGETIESWCHDLDVALSLPIRHLSTYALTFEKGTQFWNRRRRGELKDNKESIEVAMYQAVRKRAPEENLLQYEISNFAVEGFRCRHNMSYWQGDGWYAAGPGAARFVQGRREVNHRSTSNYLNRIESGRCPTAESETISLEQFARERAAFGVRLLEGIDSVEFQQATGIDWMNLCGVEIKTSIEEGLVEQHGSRIRLTERGILFADTVASRLLG